MIWQNTAISRIVNRVDAETGKAKDYFTIYEIDPSISGIYCGTITINNDDPDKTKNIKELIATGLASIKVLAGSICRIDITNDNHDNLIKNYLKIENSSSDVEDSSSNDTKSESEHNIQIKTNDIIEKISGAADEIASIFKNGDSGQKLRFTADVIRELRDKQYLIEDHLPKGNNNKDHFLWDQRSKKNTLRTILEDNARDIQHDQWRFFCESLGQKLYELTKKAITDQ